MAISTQTQNLNLIPGKSAPVVVHLSQGNVGNTVQFYLYDGDNPYYPTNVSIAVHGVRADNTVFGPYAVSVTSGSNLVSFNIASAMTSVTGAAIGELVISDSNQNQIGSANFGMLVEETPYSSSVTYEDDLSIYQRILAYVQSIPADLQSQISSEASARTSDVSNLASQISEEASVRSSAVSNLQTNISEETSARTSAVSNLQSQINQIIAPSGEAPSASEVQNARIGADGITYSTLGEAIRTQDTDLTNAITSLPKTNLYVESDSSTGHYITSAGVVEDDSRWLVTDYIPYKNTDDAYYEGITLPGGSCYSAVYDKNKLFVGTFKQETGTNNMSKYNIQDTCCYVRFSLNIAQCNDSKKFRFYSKTLATLKDLNEGIKSTSTPSPNLLDHEKDTVGYELFSNGNIQAYKTYYVSDFIPVEEGKNYVQTSFSPVSAMYGIRQNGVVCFYDSNKKYLSGITRSASAPTVTVPSGAAFVRFTSPFNEQYRTLDMFGETSVISVIYTGTGLGDWAYIPYGRYTDPITILRVEKPFIEKDWRGLWRIKFSKIYYVDFDGETRYLQYNSYITLRYQSLISNRSPAYETDTCLIEEGTSLIYSYKKKLFLIVQSSEIEENDINIFSVKNDIPSGILFDEYNVQMSFFQERTIYNTIPLSILREIDTTLDNSGVLAAESSDDVFTFVHVSDNHHVGVYMGTSVDLTGMAIKHLYSRATFDAIFNTGDEVLTATAAASGAGYNNGKVSLSNAMNAYPIEPLVFCEGNHDRGIIDEQYISHSEYYNLVLRHWKDNPDVHSVYPNSYYYRDYNDKKIRVVCLTLYNMPDSDQSTYPYNDYYGYDQAQMEWLCNTALRVDEGWSVVILVHSAPVTTAEGNTGNGGAGNNPLVLRQILEAFMNGSDKTVVHTSAEAGGFFNVNVSANFSSQGARSLIGVFSGHTHLDRIVPINGIYYDAICCGYIDITEYNGNRGTRNANSISAVCFDIGVVNKTTKTVTLTRVGFVPTDSPAVTQVRTWQYS